MADKDFELLGRLRNIVTSRREVERLLNDKARSTAAFYFKRRYSVHSVRTIMRDDLAKWLKENGFHGHGSNKLIGKAIGRALDNYEAQLKRALLDDIREAKKEGHGWRGLQEDLDAGRVGKSIGKPWYEL